MTINKAYFLSIISSLLLLQSGCMMTSQRRDQIQVSIHDINTRMKALEKKIESDRSQLDNTSQTVLASQNDLSSLQNQVQNSQGVIDELKNKISDLQEEKRQNRLNQNLSSQSPQADQLILRKVSRMELLVPNAFFVIQKTRKKLPSSIATLEKLRNTYRTQYEAGHFTKIIDLSSMVFSGQNATTAMRALSLEFRGEAYFQKKDYKSSAIALGTFVDTFPKSERYQRALLLAGDSYVYLNNHETAASYYAECKNLFPSTPEGKAAHKRLASLKSASQKTDS